MMVGMGFEKPFDIFIKLEPSTSNPMANAKNKYFIVSMFVSYKETTKYKCFFDKCQNLPFLPILHIFL